MDQRVRARRGRRAEPDPARRQLRLAAGHRAPHRAEFQDAKVVWPSTRDSSPSGLEIFGGIAYLGALRGERLWAVPLHGSDAGAPVAYFTGKYGRIRDVVRTPGGRLWLLTNNENPDFVLVLSAFQ